MSYPIILENKSVLSVCLKASFLVLGPTIKDEL